MDTNSNNNNESNMNQKELAPNQNTTEFVSGSTVVVATPQYHNKNLYDQFVKTSQTGFVDDIRSFLARPIIYSVYGLTSSNNPGDDIITYNLPDVVTGHYAGGVIVGGNTMVKNKLSGFLGLRCTFKIRLVANANPFQQGILMLRFVPFTNTLVKEALMWNANLTTKTQHHRVLLDLSCDTEAELEIPFVYPQPFINLMATDVLNTYNIGTVYVTVYSKLATGPDSTANTAELTVFGSMHDVELMGPTIPFAQSSTAVVKRSVIGIPDKEKRNAGEKPHPVSATAKLVDAVGQFGAKIPLLSGLSKPLSWMSRFIDAPAAFFGMAAPVLTNTQTAVQLLDKQYWNNSDQPRHAYVMGVHSDNDIGLLSGFGGTDLDEMSFSYISSKFAWYYTVPWTIDDAVDTRLYSQVISPSAFFTPITVSPFAGLVDVPTPVNYLARNFTFWRGSFILRIIIAKTKFHSGRLSVSYNPGNTTSVANDLTNNNSNYTYREIIDIREGNTFELVLPYISPDIWNTYTTGCSLAIHVLNPLRTPETASSSIDLLFEIAGGPDFEVAVPSYCNAQPLLPVAQSTSCEIVNTVIGGGSIVTDDYTPTALCIGEKLTSVRQILSRANFMRITLSTGSVGFNFLPAVKTANYVDSSGVLNYPPYAKPDIYSFWGSCYAMYRGSLQFIVENTGGTTTKVMVFSDLTNSAAYGVSVDYQSSAYSNTSGFNVINPPVANLPCPMFKVPFYHKNPSSLLRTCTTSSNVDSNPSFTCLTRVYVRTTGSVAVPSLYRITGDDFSFGGFVSTVPLHVGN